MTRRIIWLFLWVSMGCSAYSQQHTIGGRVTDDLGQGLSFANVLLYSASDSQLVKLELSQEEGVFFFQEIASEEYFIRISYVGLPGYESSVFVVAQEQNIQLPTIQMQAADTDLEAVVVKAQRPILELESDRMIFHVQQGIATAGNNLIELLRKSPGVRVDQNNQVSLLGKSGVNIYINDKRVPLDGEALSNYLSSIQAAEIDAIEIITNPSAKYDAEGGAGIINIRLLKSNKLGANANIDLGFTAVQTLKYRASVNGNYRNRQWNIFGSYGYSDIDELRDRAFTRQQLGINYRQVDEVDIYRFSHNGKLGLDYQPNNKHTFGILVVGAFTDRDNLSNGRVEIAPLGDNNIDSILISSYALNRHSENLTYNFNYQFKGNNKSTWNFDADYGSYIYANNNNQPNQYFNATETQTLTTRNYQTERTSDINILTFKLDHERPWWKGTLQGGLKYALVESHNDFRTYNLFGNNLREQDQVLSNLFHYEENVNAAYANYSRKFDKWGVRAGLRAEQTNSLGAISNYQSGGDSITTQLDTFNLFPSAGFSYQVNEKNTLQLSLSRRLNRPRYGRINPSIFRQDEFTFALGNANLRPEYVDQIQLSHTFNSFLNTSLTYSHTSDAFTTLMDTFNVNSIFITTYNLQDQYNYSLNMSGSFPITKWWSSYTSLTAYHLRNEAVLADGKVLSEQVNNFTVYSQHTFKLPQAFAFEALGFYSSPHIWGGTFRIDSRWRIDLGLQKKIMNGQGNIKVSATDIFKTMSWFGTNRFGVLNMDLFHTWDSRLLSVNFSYFLGNKKVKSRRRKVGLEEESKRT